MEFAKIKVELLCLNRVGIPEYLLHSAHTLFPAYSPHQILRERKPWGFVEHGENPQVKVSLKIITSSSA